MLFQCSWRRYNFCNDDKAREGSGFAMEMMLYPMSRVWIFFKYLRLSGNSASKLSLKFKTRRFDKLWKAAPWMNYILFSDKSRCDRFANFSKSLSFMFRIWLSLSFRLERALKGERNFKFCRLFPHNASSFKCVKLVNISSEKNGILFRLISRYLSTKVFWNSPSGTLVSRFRDTSKYSRSCCPFK